MSPRNLLLQFVQGHTFAGIYKLDYAYFCEVWGFENCAEIEKVHLRFCKTNDFKLHGLRGISTISFEYPHQCQNDWILVKMKEFKQII